MGVDSRISNEDTVWISSQMVMKSLVEVPFLVHRLIFIEIPTDMPTCWITKLYSWPSKTVFYHVKLYFSNKCARNKIGPLVGSRGSAPVHRSGDPVFLVTYSLPSLHPADLLLVTDKSLKHHLSGGLNVSMNQNPYLLRYRCISTLQASKGVQCTGISVTMVLNLQTYQHANNVIEID